MCTVLYLCFSYLHVIHLCYVQLTHNKPVMKPAKGTRKCNCRQEMVTRDELKQIISYDSAFRREKLPSKIEKVKKFHDLRC